MLPLVTGFNVGELWNFFGQNPENERSWCITGQRFWHISKHSCKKLCFSLAQTPVNHWNWRLLAFSHCVGFSSTVHPMVEFTYWKPSSILSKTRVGGGQKIFTRSTFHFKRPFRIFLQNSNPSTNNFTIFISSFSATPKRDPQGNQLQFFSLSFPI